MDKLVADKIKELRIKAGWTQSKLAQKIKVTPSAIWHIEKYESSISLKLAKKIADAFDVSVEELYGESQSKSGSVRAFYRKYGAIESLSDSDKEMIKKLIQRLNEK